MLKTVIEWISPTQKDTHMTKTIAASGVRALLAFEIESVSGAVGGSLFGPPKPKQVGYGSQSTTLYYLGPLAPPIIRRSGSFILITRACRPEDR